MKIFPHNFNPNSNSGPNKFTRTLFNKLIKENKVSLSSQQDADIEFCLIQQQCYKAKPMLLRLDGIWFNSDQSYKQLNAPIVYAYQNANVVIFQSEFNKKLTEHWFGIHKNSHVIHNAADLDLIKAANRDFWNDRIEKDREVWACASKWRPHKRLNDNINYFLEFAPESAVFVIAGNIEPEELKNIPINSRIKVVGELDYMSLLSLYRRSSTFVHLAYLDHCPNVVVDAQAAGCKIICSNSGGTKEVVNNGIVIEEDVWDFSPIQLYKPPEIDFSKFKTIDLEKNKNSNNIEICSKKYYNLMKSLL